MPYVDPQTIDNPTTGQPIPAAWSDQVRGNQEFFAEPPQCSVSGSNVSVNSSNWTSLTAGSEAYDTDTMHSTSSQTERITFTTAGKYLLWGVVNFAAVADTITYAVRIYVNGTTEYEIAKWPEITTTATHGLRVPFQRSLPFAASDFAVVQVWHDRGSALNAQLIEYGAVWQSR